MILIRYSIVLALLLSSSLLHAAGPDTHANTVTSKNPDDTSFAQGRRAYKAGDFQTALSWFDRAIAEGNNKATVIYNRAVTLYKLERYEAANKGFLPLLQVADWADLARYNLGLIALAQQDQATAKRWFSLLKNAENPRLQVLANKQLDALRAVNTTQPAVATPQKIQTNATKKSAVFLSMGAAHDDNASGLADELVSNSSHAEDIYMNGLAYGQVYLTGTRTEGFKVYGLAQVRRYQVFNRFDSMVAGVGSNWETIYSDWNLELGGRLLQTEINQSRLAMQYTALTKASKNLSSSRLELSQQSSFFDAGDGYNQIEGWQHQLKAMLTYKVGALQVSPAIRWEINDRNNYKTGENFYSYSPQIFALAGTAQWSMSPDWLIYGGLDWSQFEFDGQNKLTDLDGQEKQQARATTRFQASLGARYRITPNWFVKTEYNHSKNDDTFILYTQSKNVFSINLDYAW